MTGAEQNNAADGRPARSLSAALRAQAQKGNGAPPPPPRPAAELPRRRNDLWRLLVLAALLGGLYYYPESWAQKWTLGDPEQTELPYMFRRICWSQAVFYLATVLGILRPLFFVLLYIRTGTGRPVWHMPPWPTYLKVCLGTVFFALLFVTGAFNAFGIGCPQLSDESMLVLWIFLGVMTVGSLIWPVKCVDIAYQVRELIELSNGYEGRRRVPGTRFTPGIMQLLLLWLLVAMLAAGGFAYLTADGWSWWALPAALLVKAAAEYVAIVDPGVIPRA